jgi:hypothetical protein
MYAFETRTHHCMHPLLIALNGLFQQYAIVCLTSRPALMFFAVLRPRALPPRHGPSPVPLLLPLQ